MEMLLVNSRRQGRKRILLLNRSRLQIEQTAFVTESIVDTIADINSFFSIVRGILIVFGVIIMSISAMGMLNTLSVSLLQRTKEVGILKALGAKRSDIFKMFIFEAFLISFLGGSLGLLFGYGGAKGINTGVNLLAEKYGVSSMNFVQLPSAFVVSIIVFIFFLGLITGSSPLCAHQRFMLWKRFGTNSMFSLVGCSGSVCLLKRKAVLLLV
jgi:ABC-type antimicrobial peptide transport system permease subunit